MRFDRAFEIEKDFSRDFKSAMSDIKKVLNHIADDTNDLSSIIKMQSRMIDDYFKNATQSREMAAEYTSSIVTRMRYIGKIGQS